MKKDEAISILATSVRPREPKDMEKYDKAIKMAIDALNEPERKKGKWKEVYAESDGSNGWIEFQCPHCGDTFGIESGQYGWHYTDPIPWIACPMCGCLADMDGDTE